MKNLKILIVDDEQRWQKIISHECNSRGLVTTCDSKESALIELRNRKYDIAFIDLYYKGKLEGYEVIKQAKESSVYPVVISSMDKNEIFRNCYTLGAKSYLNKDRIREGIGQVFNKYHFSHKDNSLQKMRLLKKFKTQDQKLIQSIVNLTVNPNHDIPILISGPTGVGKTTIAKFLYESWFPEQDTPFKSVNCSQFSDNLLESELFGHVKGSFTGAINDKKGIFELADGGVLFLDEIHTLSLKAQQKLLKVIDEKIYSPLGSEKELFSDFKLIAASSVDLLELVNAGTFKRDLYGRIDYYNLRIPPLNERKKDIELQIDHFMKDCTIKMALTEKAINKLTSYDWPQNSRQLKALIKSWELKELTLIDHTDIEFKEDRVREIKLSHSQFKLIEKYGLKFVIDELQKQAIVKALEKSTGVTKDASNMLHISSSNLCNFYKKYNLNREAFVNRGGFR